MQESETLRPIPQHKLKEIALRYGLEEIYAFGSQAKEVAARLRGENALVASPASDVDIGVCTKRGNLLSPSERVNLALEVEDLLEVSRVDLVILQQTDPFLALEIVRGELLYAEDPDRQARFELYVLRRAGDLLPFKKERIRMILEEGAR